MSLLALIDTLNSRYFDAFIIVRKSSVPLNDSNPILFFFKYFSAKSFTDAMYIFNKLLSSVDAFTLTVLLLRMSETGDNQVRFLKFYEARNLKS